MGIYIALFFGGAFLANSLPHLWAGVTGTPLQTPFASPPFRGLSPAWVNVLWALFNLAMSYLLLIRVAELELHHAHSMAIAFAGFGLMSLQCARAFTKLRKHGH